MEFGSVRPGRLPRRAMEPIGADTVVCRAEMSAADVERFGASLSSEQRALVTTVYTYNVKFTAWPELVRLFPNLDQVWAPRCGLVEFPLALCALPAGQRRAKPLHVRSGHIDPTHHMSPLASSMARRGRRPGRTEPNSTHCSSQQ